jgi:hypothetical protein
MQTATPNPLRIGSSQATVAATRPAGKVRFRQLTTAVSWKNLDRLRKSVPRRVWVLSLLFLISVVGTLTLGSSVLISNLQPGGGMPSLTPTLRILISDIGSTSPTPFLPLLGSAAEEPASGLLSSTSTPTQQVESQIAGEPVQMTTTDTPPPPTRSVPRATQVLPSPTRSDPTETQAIPSPTKDILPTLQPTPTRGGVLPSPTEPSTEPTPEPPTPTAPP